MKGNKGDSVIYGFIYIRINWIVPYFVLSEIPQTGDDFNPGLFVGLGASALIAGVAMMKGRKKKEDEEETVNQ